MMRRGISLQATRLIHVSQPPHAAARHARGGGQQRRKQRSPKRAAPRPACLHRRVTLRPRAATQRGAWLWPRSRARREWHVVRGATTDPERAGTAHEQNDASAKIERPTHVNDGRTTKHLPSAHALPHLCLPRKRVYRALPAPAERAKLCAVQWRHALRRRVGPVDAAVREGAKAVSGCACCVACRAGHSAAQPAQPELRRSAGWCCRCGCRAASQARQVSQDGGQRGGAGGAGCAHAQSWERGRACR